MNDFPNSFREQENRAFKNSFLNEVLNAQKPVALNVLTPTENNSLICDNSQETTSDHETNEFRLSDFNKNAADKILADSNSKCEIQYISGLDEFRRKSVEDYLEMSNSILDPLPLNTKYLKALSRQKKVNELKIKNKKKIVSKIRLQDELTVPVPPTSSKSNLGICKTQNTSNEGNVFLDIGEHQNKLYYEGSIDFWEQYDPELVQNSGFAVITTKDLNDPNCVSALCFLCGSEGKI